jgi:hypothetical protein
LEDKAQEAVKMIQEDNPSFEKVKKTLELLYHKPKDKTTRMMELDNLNSVDYKDVAEFAHDLTVKAGEAYPGTPEDVLDTIVMAKLMRGLPPRLRNRFDSTRYKTTSELAQSIQQAEELDKMAGPDDSVFTAKSDDSTPVLVKPVADPVVKCAQAACGSAPDATVQAITALENRLAASDRRQEDSIRQMTKDIDQLSRNSYSGRTSSPNRTLGSLANVSAISSGSIGKSTGGDNKKKDWVPLNIKQGKEGQVANRPRQGATSFRGGGAPYGRLNPIPHSYRGGYKGRFFNNNIWEAQKAEQRKRWEEREAQKPNNPPQEETTPEKPPETQSNP